MRGKRRVISVLAMLVACAACAGEVEIEVPPAAAEETPPAAPETVAPEAAVLEELMRRAHFAYRAADDGLRAEHASYLAAVDRAGRLELVPRRPPADLAQALAPDEEVRGAAITVELRGAWRDGGPLAAMAGARIAAEPDGSATVQRGSLRERFRNGEDGVEQTFELDRAPEGEGPLRVRVAISGQPLVARTESGFHFRAEHSALGVRYGEAVWVDAAGARLPLTSRWIDGAVEIEVPAAALRDAAYPAMIDPLIGPELAVDVPVTAAPGEQRISRTAFDGTHFVVVWQSSSGADSDILGARVDASGRVVGTGTFVVSAAAGAQTSPDVACMAGHSCVAVWQSGADVLAAQIPLGTGAPGAAFAVSTAPNTQATPRVACDGRVAVPDRRCLVVYYDQRSGGDSDIYGRRIKPDGLDGSLELAVSAAAGGQFGPQVTFAGSQYVVAWQDGGGAPTARGARLFPDATLRDPAGFAISTGALGDRPCAIASDGVNALVVFGRGDAPGAHPLFAQRIDAIAGAAAGAALRLDTGLGNQCGASFDGASYLTAWATGGRVLGRRVTPAGALLEPAPVALSGPASFSSIYLDVEFGGGAHLLAWEDTRAFGVSGHDIYGARLAPDLSRATRLDTLISLVPSSWSQWNPDVAKNFESYLVVWNDLRGGGSDIYGARFSHAGALLDPTGFAISTAANPQVRPAVASDGKAFFTVWEDSRALPASGRNIYAARVDERGLLLDPAGLAVSTAAGDQGDPDIAFDDPSQTFLVAWSDRRAGNGDIYGARLDRAGAVLDPAGLVISAFAGAEQTQPAIANLPGRHLVVWADATGAALPQIWGAVVTSGGTGVSGDVQISLGDALRPAVASDGVQFFTAWQRNDLTRIDGRAVTATGARPTAEVALSPTSSGTTHPALAFDGVSYGLLYNRAQRLYGRRLTPAGGVLGAELLIQIGSGNDQFEPALTASANNRFFLAYQRFIDSPPLVAMRTMARALEF